jgi:hypothetical protein
MFTQYKTLAPAIPDYAQRIALLRELVLQNLAKPSKLELIN